jgi:hypothetical protein
VLTLEHQLEDTVPDKIRFQVFNDVPPKQAYDTKVPADEYTAGICGFESYLDIEEWGKYWFSAKVFTKSDASGKETWHIFIGIPATPPGTWNVGVFFVPNDKCERQSYPDGYTGRKE